MKASHRRKIYFQWKSSQPRLLVGIEIIFFVLLLITGGLFALVANRDLTGAYYTAHVTIRNMLEILMPSLAIVNFLGLIASLAAAVFFTHRVAGPVHRLSYILRGVGQGNLAQAVHFRKGDELKELDAASTEMIAALQARVLCLQSLSAKLDRQLESASEGLDQPEVRVMRETVRELNDQLAAFRLPPASR